MEAGTACSQCSPSPDAFCPQSPKENFCRCIHYSAWIQHTERALYLIHCGNEIHDYYHYHHSLHCSLCTRKSGRFGSKCTCFVPGSYRRVLWGRQWEMQGKPLPEYSIFWLTYVYKEKKKIAVLFRPAPVWIRSRSIVCCCLPSPLSPPLTLVWFSNPVQHHLSHVQFENGVSQQSFSFRSFECV